MSDGAVKRSRAKALLVALAIAFTGVAWAGCGDDENTTTDEARESVEQGADDAQGQAEESADEAREAVEEGADEAQQKAEDGIDEAEEGLNEAKEDAEQRADDAKEQAESYLP